MLLYYQNKYQKWHSVYISPADTSSVNIVLPHSASTKKKKRRRLVVHVIGTSEGAVSNVHPSFGLDVLDKEIVEKSGHSTYLPAMERGARYINK